jgi:uncharacterized protein YjbJ (UPF0337 family)
MNRQQFEGNWLQFKGKVKEKWGKLTDDDIAQINGKYGQLMGALQKKYGYSKEQAEREFSSWNVESRGSTMGGSFRQADDEQKRRKAG